MRRSMWIADRLRAGTWSASQLVDCYLQRIRRHDEKLHAFVEIYEEEAHIAASLLTARQTGRTPGPLHGIPIALKDLLDIEESDARRLSCSGATACRRSLPPSSSGLRPRA